MTLILYIPKFVKSQILQNKEVSTEIKLRIKSFHLAYLFFFFVDLVVLFSDFLLPEEGCFFFSAFSFSSIS